MKSMMVLLATVLAAGLVMAQTNAGQTSSDVTVRGCVSMSAAHFVLVQTDPGNTYQLEPTADISFDAYLGQQVEVSGSEATSLGSTSDLGRPGSPSPVTVKAKSVRKIADRCTAD